MSSEEEDCLTLDTLSAEDIRTIAQNPKYKQLFNELFEGHRSADNEANEGREDDDSSADEGDVVDRTTFEQQTELLVADPTQSEAEDTVPDRTATARSDGSVLDRTPIAQLGKRTHSPDREDLPPHKKGRKDSETATTSRAPVFDPVLAGSEEDDYHFRPHKVVHDYLERHFRRTLSKKERKAMIKADPKPDCEAAVTPEVDEFLQTFWKGKVNNSQDGDLKQIQTALLNTTGPLCGLWSQLLEQGLGKESDLIQAPVVLDMIQRTLVLLGNANSLISERRRAHILHAVDPKLSKYAKGEFPKAGKSLFGQSFVKEVVSQVEADTAICKASALANKAQREVQKGKGPSPPKPTFFRGGRSSGYGAGSGKNVFNPYTNRSSFRGRGRFRPNSRNRSLFTRLGPSQNSSESSPRSQN